jgi:hypothetical protein
LLTLVYCGVNAETWTLDDGLVVSDDYGGGNIIVDSARGDTVYVRPDNTNHSPAWFYWNFSVKNSGSRRIYFKFDTYRMYVNGPCISLDTGKTWQWQANGTAWQYALSFGFTFTDSSEKRFAFTIPYTERELRSFLDAHQNNPYIRDTILCLSDSGRNVELIRAGCINETPRHRIFLSSRHHACEATGSIVLEGMVEATLADDSLGRWCRKNLEILAVPLVDKDGVELGEQGKNRQPHDHNRDYRTVSIYPSTRAIREKIPLIADTILRMAFDIHAPGQTAENLHMMADTTRQNDAYRYAAILEDSQSTDGYIYKKNTAYNSFINSTDYTCRKLLNNLPGIRFACTFEIPYTTMRNSSSEQRKSVTKEGLKNFGRNMLDAARILLQEKYPENPDPVIIEKCSSAKTLSVKVTPNPFNPATEIECHIPDNNEAVVVITDITGKTIRKINISGAGFHRFNFDAGNGGGRLLSSSVYIVSIRTLRGKTGKSVRLFLTR